VGSYVTARRCCRVEEHSRALGHQGETSRDAHHLDPGTEAHLIGEGQDYATVAYDAITGEQIQVARYDGPAGWDAANPLAVGPDGSLYVTGESASRHYRDYGTIRYVLE
jgi:hypothetical protein